MSAIDRSIAASGGVNSKPNRGPQGRAVRRSGPAGGLTEVWLVAGAVVLAMVAVFAKVVLAQG